MPHRGRMPLQTTMLNMRPAKIFHKLSGESEFPDDAPAMSDTLSHFSTSSFEIPFQINQIQNLFQH